jgi:hypothetical protein
MREGADRYARVREQLDDSAPNSAGRSGHEYRRNPRHIDVGNV